jgi:PAS domain S-box-containing protein
MSERDGTERALHASEERFRRYFELGLIGMAMTSPTKGILEVNDELCRILGYERGELLQKTWVQLTHPDSVAADVAQFDRVMSGEIDGYTLDKRWIRKDGAIIDTILAARCVRDRDGVVDAFVGLVQDITERKRAETETLALKNTLGTELDAMKRLHEFSTRQLTQTDHQRLLEDVLDAIVSLQSADFGTLQLYSHDTQTLDMVAHRGFGQAFLDQFRHLVTGTGTAGDRALRRRERVIIEDIETDADFGPYRALAAAAGFRAVQSTPMFSRSGEPLGIISTNFRRPSRPSDDVLRMTDLYARQAAEMIASKQAEAALLRYQQELQDLTTRLIEAQESQSKHLARELHDVFTQKLAVIGITLAALARTPHEPPEVLAGALLRLGQEVGTLATDIHRMARQIHPSILDDLGLAAAVRSECLAFSEQHHVPTDFVAEHLPSHIPEDVATCLYRIAQEALRNVAKHAAASHVRVRLSRQPSELSLTIDDSGQGFDLNIIKGKRGLGLVSMEERLRIVGGTLAIRAQPGGGTHIDARVPIVR